MTIKECIYFLSPKGQEEMLDFVREANEVRAKPLLDFVAENYPQMYRVVELVVAYDGETAFDELCKEFPLFPLKAFKPQIIALHARLNAEIQKPKNLPR